MPAKLFVAVMFREEDVLASALDELEESFGEVDLRSEVFDFNFTRYYEAEFGAGLRKLFAGFAGPFERDRLVEAKLTCLEIERRLSRRGRRRVNLDPGYVTLHSVVLSSRKDRAHRIYLGEGVFAEVTLLYQRGRYRPLPWSYADYRTEVAQSFFLAARERLRGRRAER
ncbi:MAG: DUF4416 family protein [Euryarchaeota archaeon]|nr:DUF4416 family protein [Euryarchaeota archaeon]